MLALHSAPAILPLLATFAIPLASAASCLGVTCKGKEPRAMGCDADAESIETYIGDYGLIVDVRYSRTCRAWWARATCKRDEDDWGWGLYVNLWQFYGRQSYSQRVTGDRHAIQCAGGATGWTYMLDDRDASDYYTACWVWSDWEHPKSPREGDARGCTDRVTH